MIYILRDALVSQVEYTHINERGEDGECARAVLTIVSYVMPNAGHTYIVGDDLSLIEGYSCL